MKKLTCNQVASILCKDPQFVRIGIQNGIFDWGIAIKTRGNKYSYLIIPAKFWAFMGCSEEEYYAKNAPA